MKSIIEILAGARVKGYKLTPEATVLLALSVKARNHNDLEIREASKSHCAIDLTNSSDEY